MCHARKVKGCGRNRRGFLVLTDRRLIFVFRKWFRTRARAWEIADLEKIGLNPRFLVDVLRVMLKGDGERKDFDLINDLTTIGRREDPTIKDGEHA